MESADQRVRTTLVTRFLPPPLVTARYVPAAMGLPLRSVVQNLPCHIETRLVPKAAANIQTVNLQEGEDHASAEQQGVHLVQQVEDDINLATHLGTTQYSHEGPLRIGHQRTKKFQFLFHQETRPAGFKMFGDPDGGGMGAVRRTECIVDVGVAEFRQAGREPRVVSRFTGIEPEIFQQQDFPRGQTAGLFFRIGSDRVEGKPDRGFDELAQAIRHRTQ